MLVEIIIRLWCWQTTQINVLVDGCKARYWAGFCEIRAHLVMRILHFYFVWRIGLRWSISVEVVIIDNFHILGHRLRRNHFRSSFSSACLIIISKRSRQNFKKISQFLQFSSRYFLPQKLIVFGKQMRRTVWEFELDRLTGIFLPRKVNKSYTVRNTVRFSLGKYDEIRGCYQIYRIRGYVSRVITFCGAIVTHWLFLFK